MRDEVRNGQHVGAAHAGGHEGLVGVAEGGVGDEEAGLGGHPLREVFGTEFVEELFGAFWGRGRMCGGMGGGAEVLGPLVCPRLPDFR